MSGFRALKGIGRNKGTGPRPLPTAVVCPFPSFGPSLTQPDELNKISAPRREEEHRNPLYFNATSIVWGSAASSRAIASDSAALAAALRSDRFLVLPPPLSR